MTNLISPEQLEADAVVPQCLDNQYVSDDTYSFMLHNDKTYQDSVVIERREQEAKTEFIRSLVYSSQVVIQRAFLKNNPFVYKNYLPEDIENTHAFMKLLETKAIVPFLFKESSLTDNLEFDLLEEGDRALKKLINYSNDDITCVRLAISEEENETKTDIMSKSFGDKISNLNSLRHHQTQFVADELFNRKSEINGEELEYFRKSLKKLARYAFEKSDELSNDDRYLTRNHIYKDHFIFPETNVAEGKFIKPNPENPYVKELKKYVDLIYNVNLPDCLNRYTFTPVDLPSRMALQDLTPNNFKVDDIEKILCDKDFLHYVSSKFMASTQKAMSLPILNEMNVVDVLEVRQLPEWQNFKESQIKILKNPLNFLNLIDTFQNDFEHFQESLSGWYNKKYEYKKTEARYCSYVSIGISLAGKLIVAGSDLVPLGATIADFTLEKAIEHIPEKVKGYAAKLMVNVYDIGAAKLDRDKSYTIELMQTNAEVHKSDVINLLSKIIAKTGEGIPPIYGRLSDKGID